MQGAGWTPGAPARSECQPPQTMRGRREVGADAGGSQVQGVVRLGYSVWAAGRVLPQAMLLPWFCSLMSLLHTPDADALRMLI
jgi:hypothetical protein